MFKKFSKIQDRNERLEIYNLLKFNLGVCRRLVELLMLAVLVSGFAGLFCDPLLELGFFPGSTLAVGLLLLVIWLTRLPFVFAAGQLDADFGLDPRPFRRRLKLIVQLELRRAALLWLISLPLLFGLRYLDLWAWALAALAFGALLITLDAMFPRFMRPDKLRAPHEGELPPSLLAKIESWEPQTGLAPRSLTVSTEFTPELKPPVLTGLGPTLKVVIPEKALASFPSRELSVLVVTAVVGALVKTPLKFLLLRFCALAVAVPLASILIGALGAGIWLYPLTVKPGLIVLIWGGMWVGHSLAEFADRLIRRGVDTQLAAAAALLLKDEESLVHAMETLAEKNLEEESPPVWREIFRPRHTRRIFIRKAKYHRHMSQFHSTE